MTRIATLIESPPADLLPPSLRETSSDQGDKPPPHGDKLMRQILASLLAMPRDDVLKRIASLPRARQNAVLEIRRTLIEGTYEIKDRLGEAMDRVLDIIAD